MINQIYYINLDRSKERMLFQENNGKKINFPMTRFNAVDGKKIKPEFVTSLLKQKKIHLTLFNVLNSHNPIFFLKRGTLACTLSHISLLECIKNINGNTLITEDDNDFLCDTFISDINLILPSLPNDWDVVFFSNEPRNETYLFDYNKHFYRLKQIDIFDYTTFYSNCYLVNQNSVNKLLQKPMNDDIDVMLTKSGLNVYITKENMVCQKNSFKSDRLTTDRPIT
jgi:GR25 family glycosyltransferase involved in LPS biosynthesis